MNAAKPGHHGVKLPTERVEDDVKRPHGANSGRLTVKEYGPWDMGTMNSAKTDATATLIEALISTALHKDAIYGAIKDILQENEDGCNYIDTCLPEKEIYSINKFLLEERALFPIQIELKNGHRKKATLRLSSRSISLKPKKLSPIVVPLSVGFEIRANKGLYDDPAFVLYSSNGFSYICHTNWDRSLRDKIVLTTKAFLLKALLLDAPIYCRKSSAEVYLENDVVHVNEVQKDGELERHYGQDDISVSKESPAIKEENELEDKGTVMTATAALHKDAIDGVIDDILRENVEGCDVIDPCFLENERDIITDSLSKELAEFDIKINMESVTLRLTRGCIKLLFASGQRICEALSFGVEIKALEKRCDIPQFILKFANGDSYTCEAAKGDLITRDKIVVTAKAFLLKLLEGVYESDMAAGLLAVFGHTLDKEVVMASYDDPPKDILPTLQREKNPPLYQLPLKIGMHEWNAEQVYGTNYAS